MTETKFTPGPWELVSLSGYGNPFSVRMPYIADTAKPDQTHYGIQSIRRREDANLVVAAPELYAALEAAIEEINHLRKFAGDNGAMIDDTDFVEGIAALAKARGEA